MTVNSADWVELQSLLRLPATVTLSAKKTKKKRQVSVSGSVTEGGKAVAGAKVEIRAGTRVLATLTTSVFGAFTGTVKLPSASATLVAATTVPDRDLGATACTPLAEIYPCIAATAPRFTATSKPVKIKT